MTNKERRTKIENRLQELETLRIQRDLIDEKFFFAEGQEYYDAVVEARDIRKRIIIVEEEIKKMIERLMYNLYGYYWLNEKDFCEYVRAFKKLAY